MADVAKLMHVLSRLVDAGSTGRDHRTQPRRCCGRRLGDRDLGPEGGSAGGRCSWAKDAEGDCGEEDGDREGSAGVSQAQAEEEDKDSISAFKAYSAPRSTKRGFPSSGKAALRLFEKPPAQRFSTHQSITPERMNIMTEGAAAITAGGTAAKMER